ncbi:MAG: hypothetical protein K6U02_04010 [Firmicutes bacterium]|nr:hypothetical protein [Bacillota bacterium]
MTFSFYTDFATLSRLSQFGFVVGPVQMLQAGDSARQDTPAPTLRLEREWRAQRSHQPCLMETSEQLLATRSIPAKLHQRSCGKSAHNHRKNFPVQTVYCFYLFEKNGDSWMLLESLKRSKELDKDSLNL